jgi:hypothetical protein
MKFSAPKAPAVQGPRTFDELAAMLENAPANGTVELSQDIHEPPVYNWQPIAVRSGVTIKGNGFAIGSANDPSRQLSAPLIGNGAAAINNLTVENLTLHINFPNLASANPVGGVVTIANNSKFTNVNVCGVSAQPASLYVGGIAGESRGATSFTSCKNYADIIGLTDIGGIAGYAYSAGGAPTFSDCTNAGALRSANPNPSGGAEANIGGIVGSIRSGSIERCVNNGDISAICENVGGIAGRANAASIANSSNRASVSGASNNMAGIAGIAADAVKITNCSNSGAISPQDSAVGCCFGGIAGNLSTNGLIEHCVNTGAINGSEAAVGAASHVGGIVGHIFDNCNVLTSTNRGIVRGVDCAGGIAGVAESESPTRIIMSNNINTGDVACTGINIGGILGVAYSAVTVSNNSTVGSTGTIQGAKNIGGIVGFVGRYANAATRAGASVIENNRAAAPLISATGIAADDGVRRILGNFETNLETTLTLNNNYADTAMKLEGSNTSLYSYDYNAYTTALGALYNKSVVLADGSDHDYGLNRMNGLNRTLSDRSAGGVPAYGYACPPRRPTRRPFMC